MFFSHIALLKVLVLKALLSNHLTVPSLLFSLNLLRKFITRESLEKRYNERIDIYRGTADVTVDGAGTVEETAERAKENFLKY